MYRYLLILLIITVSLSAEKLSSEKIFAKLEPSIVYLGNEEGFGSGIIISEKGEILTNYHVVCTALPLIAKIKQKTDKGHQEKEYKVELVKVHKSYDLAILQIQDLKGDLSVVSWGKELAIPKGSKCFAIGNPTDGKDSSLRNTITSGLVSAIDRVHEGKKYLQTSAPVNPGNSGGALVNESGDLIGVVTFKALGVEGIGFAIPSLLIKREDFIIPKMKKNNMELGGKYEKQAERFLQQGRYINDPEVKKQLFSMSCYFYKMSMLEMPNHSSPYNNVGLLYKNLKKFELAKAYYHKCLEMADVPEACHSLGNIYSNEKNIKKAMSLWVKGAFMKGNAAPCAENASIFYFKQKKYVEAFYLSQKSLLQDRYRYQHKQNISNGSKLHISSVTQSKILSKKTWNDFSMAEMKKLAIDDSLLIKVEKAQKEKSKKADQESVDLFNELNK